MDFALFILVTAILFIRPSDFIPGPEGANLYLIAIVPCIMLSWHKIVPQLTTAALRQSPLLVFGLGVLLVSVVSNLVYRQFQVGFDFVVAFGKILIFYVLMVAHVNSPSRLRLFLGYLVGIILIPIAVVVLNYHEYIYIESFKVLDDAGSGVRRLAGEGNFGDPNDICEIVNCAMIFSLYGLLDRGGGCTRVIWLAPLALFGHALALTHSRGGFLAAVVGVVVSGRALVSKNSSINLSLPSATISTSAS